LILPFPISTARHYRKGLCADRSNVRKNSSSKGQLHV